MLAVGDRKERQPGRAPEGVGRDKTYLESLSNGDDVLLSVRQRKDVVGDMRANRPAVVYLGRDKPVSEDYPGSATTYRNAHPLTVALQRNEAPGRIVADSERQAPEVARTDFGGGARAQSLQAAIQVLCEVEGTCKLCRS